jgi:hypothetical protein
MSALGQKQTLQSVGPMSALPSKADIADAMRNVRFVPKADIAAHSIHVALPPKADIGESDRPAKAYCPFYFEQRRQPGVRFFNLNEPIGVRLSVIC